MFSVINEPHEFPKKRKQSAVQTANYQRRTKRYDNNANRVE